MTLLQSILLGIVQGLTEFLPVSSSGHLALVQHFFGFQGSEDLTFEIFLHLGTVLAVLIYFRKMILELFISLFKWGDSTENRPHRYHRNLIFYLIVATFATGVVYLIAGKWFESLEKYPVVVAAMLIITGIIIFISDYIKNGSIPAVSMGIIRSFVIGIAQGIAIIPGISRSGSTISASLFSGVRRKDAASFSFLLSIPAIMAANILKYKELTSLGSKQLFIYLAGFIASFVVGYAVIALMISLIQRAKLKYFAIYCWVIGFASIIYFSVIR